MARILFFNPPSRRLIYLATNAGVGAPSYPSLTLATLAGNLTSSNEVKIVDLELFSDIYAPLFGEIESFNPDIIASTVNTPAYPVVKEIMGRIKARYPGIKTIVGGVHITALPEEAAKEKAFDMIAVGEADTFIAGGKPVSDINTLPYPAWHLFQIDRYRNSRLSSRKNPVGLIETSRGCAFGCIFCNKLTFGSRYRAKAPRRVVDEIEYMLKGGFKEIHIVDDSFTQDIARAKEICAEIVRRNLRFPWSLINGVRADMVDKEFFTLAKRAGCWQTGFGIETGDEAILKLINKGITLAASERAVRLAQGAGIDTFGFFIIALAGETEESLRRTIEFAKKLPLATAKFDICIPYPGTPYYKELKAQGRILTEDWSKYNCHQIEEPLFNHPNLSWPTIRYYYKKAFREFYFRPGYFIRRFIRDLRMGDLFYDLGYFLKSKW